MSCFRSPNPHPPTENRVMRLCVLSGSHRTSPNTQENLKKSNGEEKQPPPQKKKKDLPWQTQTSDPPSPKTPQVDLPRKTRPFGPGRKVREARLQNEVLGEVSVSEGGQFGAKFSTKFATKFFTKFSGLFCWDIQSNKNFSKNFSPKFPGLCTAKLEIFQGKTS